MAQAPESTEDSTTDINPNLARELIQAAFKILERENMSKPPRKSDDETYQNATPSKSLPPTYPPCKPSKSEEPAKGNGRRYYGYYPYYGYGYGYMG